MYRAHKDILCLINQQNNHDKLYDHDIFLEPALAQSLHLRDIPSDPKDSVQQSVSQVCWKQQNRLDLLQCRKIQIPYGKDMQSQLFISQPSSSEKECNGSPFQDHQNNKTTAISVHSRKLFLSLKK